MAGINIAFAADVSKFIGGTKDIGKALDGVSDSLDDLAKDGEKAGKKIGDELSDGAKEAGEGADKAEKKFRDAFDKVSGDARKAGDDVGDQMKKGFKKAESGAEEFKDEAKSTAREGAASFTGEFEDVADVIQETLANSLAGFGPVGAAAGMAAAAGIGILVSVLQQSADKAAENKEKIIELAGAIREAGGDIDRVDWAEKMTEFADAISDPKSWFEPWQEASRTNAEVIAADAEKLGLDYRNLFQGLAGDTDAATRALAEIETALAAQREEQMRLIAEGFDPATAASMTLSAELETQRSRLEDATEATEDAVDLERLHREAIEGSTAAAQLYNEELRTKADLTSEATTTELDYLDAVDETNAKIAENGASLDNSTQKGRDNQRALIDLKDDVLAYAQATEEATGSTEAGNAKLREGREAFIRAAEAAGATRQQAEALADQYGLIPRSVETTIELRGYSETYRYLQNINAQLRAAGGTTRVALGPGGSGGTTLNSGGQVPVKAASGTFVSGAGSDIDDRVPARLSPGEFVLDAQATQQIGVGNLQQLGEGQNPFALATPPRSAAPTITVNVHATTDNLADEIGRVVSRRLSDALRAEGMAGRPV